MTRNEILKIIKNEEMDYYNWYNSQDVYGNQVCIDISEDKWVVFTTNEKRYKVTEICFNNESDVLKEFIKRLRASNRRRNRN